MDANFNQEALSARTLRLQKKNDAPSTAQSHSHASTVEAQRTFSHLEQVAHRQISPNIHARTSINAPTPPLVYTPVISKERRAELDIIEEEETNAQPPSRTPGQQIARTATPKAKSRIVAPIQLPIQNSNLLNFFLPKQKQLFRRR
jgi:hypothetical protein